MCPTKTTTLLLFVQLKKEPLLDVFFESDSNKNIDFCCISATFTDFF